MPIRKISGITSSLVTIAKTRSNTFATKATVTQNNLLAKAQTNISITKAATQQARLVDAAQISAEGLIRQFRDYQYMQERTALFISKLFTDDVTMLDLIGVSDGAIFDFELFEPEFFSVLESIALENQVYRPFADSVAISSKSTLDAVVHKFDDFLLTDVLKFDSTKALFDEQVFIEREKNVVDFKRIYEDFSIILDETTRATTTNRYFDHSFSLSTDEVLDIGKVLFEYVLFAEDANFAVSKALTNELIVQSKSTLSVSKFFADDFSMLDLVGVYDGAIFEFDLFEPETVAVDEQSVFSIVLNKIETLNIGSKSVFFLELEKTNLVSVTDTQTLSPAQFKYETILLTDADPTFNVVQRKFDALTVLEKLIATKQFNREGEGFTDSAFALDRKSLAVALQGLGFDFSVSAETLNVVLDSILRKKETVPVRDITTKFIRSLKKDFSVVLDRPYLKYSLGTIADSFTFDELVIVLIIVSELAFDEFSVFDTEPFFTFKKSRTDLFNTTDRFTRAANFSRKGNRFADALNLGDFETLRASLRKFDTQQIVSRINQKRITLTKIDSVLSREAISKNLVKPRRDSITINDRSTRSPQKNFFENLNLLDTAIQDFVFGRLPVDLINILERKSFNITKDFSDAFSLIEETGVYDGLEYQYFLRKFEEVFVTDFIIYGLLGVRNPRDTIQVGSSRYFYNENLFPNSENFIVAPAWVQSGVTLSIPFDGANNLLIGSEAINTAPWTAVASVGTFSTNAVAGPFGGAVTAEQYNNSGGTTSTVNVQQTVSTLVVGRQYNFSIYVLGEGGTQRLNFFAKEGLSSGATSVSTQFVISTAWARYSVSFTANTTVATVGFSGAIDSSGSFDNLYYWGAQLEFGSAAGTYIGTTATAIIRYVDFTTPDGITTSVTKLAETAVSSAHFTYFASLGPVSNRLQTFSVYAKAAEKDKVWLQLSNFSTASVQARFNLLTGVIDGGPNNTADYTSSAATIEEAGNGWYRLTLTAKKLNANTSSVPGIWLDNNVGLGNYLGVAGSGVYIWGSQIGTYDVPHPYLKTSGAIIPATKLRGDSSETIIFDVKTRRTETAVITDREAWLLTKPKADQFGVSDRRVFSNVLGKFDPVRISRTDFSSYTTVAGNMVLFSEDLSNVIGWTTAANIRVSSNVVATLAPDGAQTAEKISETTVNGQHALLCTSVTFVASTLYNVSVYAKAADTNRTLQFTGINLTTVLEVPTFNLAAGTVAVSSGSSILKSATIQPVGNGWYRCSMVVQPNSTGGRISLNISTSITAGLAASYTGTTGAGIYVWGAQITTGSTLQAYVRTTSAAITLNVYTSGLTERAVATEFERVLFNVRKPLGTHSAIITDAQIFEFAANRRIRETLTTPDSTYIVPGKVIYPADFFTMIDSFDYTDKLEYDLYISKTNDITITDREAWFYRKPITNFPHGYTNLLIRSEEFQTANIWVTSNSTILADVSSAATLAPNGTATADKLRENTATAQHFVYHAARGPASSASAIETFSVYLKAAERRYGWIQLSNLVGSGMSAFFDLSSGTIAAAASSFGAEYSNGNATIDNAGNGWYRCSITARKNFTVNNTSVPVIGVASSLTTTVYIGVATSGIYVWGAQLVSGETPYSYIQTTSATRRAFVDGSQNVTIVDAERWLYSKPRSNSVSISDARARLLPRLLKRETVTLSDRNRKDITIKVPLYSYSTSVVQNLYLYSEDISNAAWVKSTEVQISVNGTTSPDGTNTADKVYARRGTAASLEVYQTITTTLNSYYVHSIYVKSSEYRYLQIAPDTNFSTAAWANFDATAGTYSLQGTVTTQTAGIENIGNGWKRCWMRVQATAAGTGIIYNAIVNSLTATRRLSFSLTNQSGLFVWGGQISIDTLSPYVRTTSTTYTQSTLIATPLNSVAAVDDFEIRNTRVNRIFDDEAISLDDSRLLIGKRFVGRDFVTLTDTRPRKTIAANKVETLLTGDSRRYDFFKPIPNSAPGRHTNIVKYSEQFEVSAAWTTATNVRVSSNVTTAPNGTNTADALLESTTTGQHYLQIVGGDSVSTSTPINISVYAKALTIGRNLQLGGFNLGNVLQAPVFNLATGTVSVSSGTSILKSATIEPVGNGWYRCSAVVQSNTSVNQFLLGVTTSITAGAIITYAGTTGSGIYVWGAQISQESRLNAYVQTTSAARTIGDAFEQQVTILDFIVLNKSASPNEDDLFFVSDLKRILVTKPRQDTLSIADVNTKLIGIGVPTTSYYQIQNLYIRSEELNTSWTISNIAVAANVSSAATLAPNGTQTADKIAETNTTTNQRPFYQDRTVTSGTYYIHSVYAKAAQRSVIQIGGSSLFSNSNWGSFDLLTGQAYLNGTGITTETVGIEDAGDGWYRCYFGAPATGSGSGRMAVFMVLTTSAARGASYQGVIGSGLYIWGNQLNTGQLYPYTPTTATTVALSSVPFLINNFVVEDYLRVTNGRLPRDTTTIADTKRLFVSKPRSDSVLLTDARVKITAEQGKFETLILADSERYFYSKPIPNSAIPTQSNYLKYSEEFGQSSVWSTGNNTRVSSNVVATTAPDGTSTADKVSENTVNGNHTVSYTGLGTSSTNIQQTFSVYAKAAERNVVAIQLTNQVAFVGRAFFNLSSGTIIATTSNGEYSQVSATIDNAGSGWYRLSVSAFKGTTTSLSSVPAIVLVSGVGTNITYAGTTNSGVYVWGASLSFDRRTHAYVQTTANAILNVAGDTFEQQVTVGDDPIFEYAADRQFTESSILLDVKKFDVTHSRTELASIADRPFKLIGKTAPYSEYFTGENLYIRSEDLGNAAWVTSHSSISIAPNVTATTDPVGTNTAEKFYENTGGNNSARNYYQLHSVVTGQFYVHSVYAKAAERTFLQIAGGASYSTNAWANFDLTNIAYSLQGTVTTETAGIEDVGNGWRRCWIRIVATSTNATAQVRYGIVTALNASRLPSVSSVSGNGIYIWGNQLNNNTLQNYTQTTSSAIAFYEYYNLLNRVTPTDVNPQKGVGKGRFETITLTDADRYDGVKALRDVPLLLDDTNQAADFRRTLSPDSFTIGNQDTIEILNQQNFFTYSEQFEVVGSWTTSNVTVSSNSTIAPDGTTTADRIVEGTTTNQHYIANAGFSLTSGVTYNVSIYGKGSTAGRYLQFTGLGLGGNNQAPVFDVITGVAYLPTSNSSIFKSGLIEAVGDGWYRCSMVVVPSNNASMIFALSNTTSTFANVSYTGTTNAGLFLWGAQGSTGSTLYAYTRTTSTGISLISNQNSAEPKSLQEIRSLASVKLRTDTFSQSDQEKFDVSKGILGRPADINIVSSQGTVVFVNGLAYALEDYFAETYDQGTRSTQTF